MRRAQLLVSVKGMYVSFQAFTYGWVRLEDGRLWFSNDKSFTREITVQASEFKYL